jgi:PIN domain nuclease of toxin-antitoxin system
LNLLLDTHVWIWSHLEPHKLAKPVLRAIEDPANEVWLSPISVWETAILVEKRRVIVEGDFDEWIGALLNRPHLKEAPITAEVALATNAFRVRHRDPADAFLAATAKVYGLTLVTADTALLRSKEIATLPCR